MLLWCLLIGTSSASSFSGVWHSIDVPSVVCPGQRGFATITISKPTTAEYEPHILSVFRTAEHPVQLSFVAKDANNIVADQRSGVTLQGHARRLQTKEQLQLSNLTENKTFLRPCAGKECPEVVRRLYSMRRRASTSMRRRGSIKPININPMSWFTPRRRRAYSATGAAAAAYGGAAAGAARRRGTTPTGDTGAGAGAVGGGSYSSVRRRISSMGTSSFHRRRSTPGFGGSYSNPYSSYSAPYGYPSSGWAYQSFGGHMPTSTPYGYTGASAYSSSSGVEIALAAGAGLLAGYALGHHHHHWNGYSQADMFGMQCISGAWSGRCNSCVSTYGANSCNVLVSPKFDAARDDLMSTGFVPSEISWPLVVNVTHIAGEDFRPSTICPPEDPDAKSAWKAPPMKDLFIALSALPSQQPSMLGNGPGYDRYDPYGYGMADHGGSSTVFSNLVLLCSCLGCCYMLERCRKNIDGPPSGNLYAGVLPAQGFSTGPAQPGHYPQHQEMGQGHIVQGQVVHDPAVNPYWRD